MDTRRKFITFDCCDVVAPGIRVPPKICDRHRADGWLDTYRGPDRARMQPCGCRDTVLYNVQLEKCPTHSVGPMACCPLARMRPCVCAYAYDCPEHGEQHIGSHD